jgi:hypothetical protein
VVASGHGCSLLRVSVRTLQFSFPRSIIPVRVAGHPASGREVGLFMYRRAGVDTRKGLFRWR